MEKGTVGAGLPSTSALRSVSPSRGLAGSAIALSPASELSKTRYVARSWTDVGLS